jgi:hypothetical protein
MKKVIIGIAYHKNSFFYKETPYLPIQVGAINQPDLGIQKDSDGDNISNANSYCSEMSATYWIWKNTQAEYKGLFHYRRFLSFEKQSPLKRLHMFALYYLTKMVSPIIKNSGYGFHDYPTFQIKENEVPQALSKFANMLYKDIDINQTQCYALSAIKLSTIKIRSLLKSDIGLWHYEFVYSLIKNEFPIFFPYFDKTLRGSRYHSCNIIIAQSDLFDEYCTIVFSILEKYHAHMNESIPNNIKNNALFRDSGYIAEYITDAFINMVEDRGIRVKYLGETIVDFHTTSESQKIATLWERINNIIN